MKDARVRTRITLISSHVTEDARVRSRIPLILSHVTEDVIYSVNADLEETFSYLNIHEIGTDKYLSLIHI